MLEGYTWNLGEYVSARGTSATDSITVYEAEHFLELCPPPPKRDELNDYIVKAQATRELRYLAFFLHYYEKRLNHRIKAFLHADGTLRCSPDAFMDYKLACLAVILRSFQPIAPMPAPSSPPISTAFSRMRSWSAAVRRSAGRFRLWSTTKDFGGLPGSITPWEIKLSPL